MHIPCYLDLEQARVVLAEMGVEVTSALARDREEIEHLDERKNENTQSRN